MEDLFKISLRPSMYMLKSLGVRMPPWRRPLVTLNFNATKSFCTAFTPKHCKLLLSSLFMNSLPILYADSIKYLGFIFTRNKCDDFLIF